MELPNLQPDASIQGVHALVAPSHYAAAHSSVQAYVTATSEQVQKFEVVVIPPGVDPELFLPTGRVTCHKHCSSAPTPENTASADSADAATGSTSAAAAAAAGTTADAAAATAAASSGDSTMAAVAANECNPACSVVGFVARLAPEKSCGLFLMAAAIVHRAAPFTRYYYSYTAPAALLHCTVKQANACEVYC
jgi:glycosyltransferase involved in cell wall biosynthesis